LFWQQRPYSIWKIKLKLCNERKKVDVCFNEKNKNIIWLIHLPTNVSNSSISLWNLYNCTIFAILNFLFFTIIFIYSSNDKYMYVCVHKLRNLNSNLRTWLTPCSKNWQGFVSFTLNWNRDFSFFKRAKNLHAVVQMILWSVFKTCFRYNRINLESCSTVPAQNVLQGS